MTLTITQVLPECGVSSPLFLCPKLAGKAGASLFVDAPDALVQLEETYDPAFAKRKKWQALGVGDVVDECIAVGGVMASSLRARVKAVGARPVVVTVEV